MNLHRLCHQFDPKPSVCGQIRGVCAGVLSPRSAVELGALALSLLWNCAGKLGLSIFGLWHILWWQIFGVCANARCHLVPQLNLWLWRCTVYSIVPSSLPFRASSTLVIVTWSNTVLFWLGTICGFCICTSVLQSLWCLLMRVVTSFIWTCCFGIVHLIIAFYTLVIVTQSNTVLFWPCTICGFCTYTSMLWCFSLCFC